MLLLPVACVVLAVGIFLSRFDSRPGVATLSLPSWRSASATAAASNEEKPGEMVEVTVRDVIPIAEANAHAVLLVSSDDSMLLPLFVTEEAAVSIAFRLAEQESPHPLAADLLDDVVAEMGGSVTEVQIDEVQDDIYMSHVVIRQGEKAHRISARPSDAIAMALTGKAKIFCAQEVLAEAGISREEIEALRDQMGVGGSEPQDPGAMPPQEPMPPPDVQAPPQDEPQIKL